MAAQKFTLPSMPFHREVHNGCSIGTSIIVKARAYQDQQKGFTLQLASAADIALQIVCPVNKQGTLKMSARQNGQFTSEVEKPIYVPLNQPFTLHVRIDTHVSEVYYNDNHLGDFVHRVNPLMIKEVSLEGPLMVDEVVFRPPQGASLSQVPSYDEVAKSSIPVQQMANMSLGGPSVLPPAAPPSSVPGASSSLPVLQPTGVVGGPTSVVGPPPAGTVLPPYSTKPAPYPEENRPSPAPALPPKKKDIEGAIQKPPPYIPQNQVAPPSAAQIAQVAPLQNPSPQVPPVSNSGMSSKPNTAYYPQQGTAPTAPAAYPGYPNYPGAPGTSATYPPATAYPGAPGAPGAQPMMNTYPGPNGPPPPQMYPSQYPGASTSYVPPVVVPQQQVIYPQQYPTYVAPSYPAYGYGYPTVYYDDCHHHHHHC